MRAYKGSFHLAFELPPLYLESMKEQDLLARITLDPLICHGKPCIRGLRYPVEGMLEYLAGGDTVADILAEFPDLEEADILACLAYAAASLRMKSVVVIPFAA